MSSGETLAIVGVGLIGGSLGLSWRAAGFTVLGVDEPNVARRALERGAIDAAVSLAEAIARADMVVLAVPVREIIRLAGAIAPLLRPRQIVTDVGGTKAAVVAAWERALSGSDAHFVGGHPMFGREVSGIDAADGSLVSGARYILTPTARTPQAVVERLLKLVAAAGAEPALISPEEHDDRIAMVSHLPQLIATALAAAAFEMEQKQGGTLSLSGPGFRDTTRLAGSPADIWTDVLLTNEEAMRGALSTFREQLAALEGAIERHDTEAMREIFAQAHGARQKIK